MASLLGIHKLAYVTTVAIFREYIVSLICLVELSHINDTRALDNLEIGYLILDHPLTP
jgi:hypothetical protein